jgi:hypothetical protein
MGNPNIQAMIITNQSRALKKAAWETRISIGKKAANTVI